MPKYSIIGAHRGVIRIVVAHDHRLFREGINRLFLDEHDLRIVAEANNGEEALRASLELIPDILLLDGLILRRGALAVLRELFEAPIKTRSILFADEQEKWLINEAVVLGIRAIVPKETSAMDLFKIIRCVASGEYWLNRNLMAEVMRQDRNHSESFDYLTAREMQIVAEVAAGSCNLEIARKMGISQDTVKRHLANVFQKLGLSSRLELAVHAIKMGFGAPALKQQARSA